jgi:hypothetical protein
MSGTDAVELSQTSVRRAILLTKGEVFLCSGEKPSRCDSMKEVI